MDPWCWLGILGSPLVMAFNLGLLSMIKVSWQAECEVSAGFPGDRVVTGKAVGVVEWDIWGVV